MIRIVLWVFLICLYGLVLLTLLLTSLGFGLRIGSTIYAEEGFGYLRISSIFLLLLLLVLGFYLTGKFMIELVRSRD